MARPIKHQVINLDGKPAFAVVPWDEYQQLIKNQLPDEDVFIPHDVVKAHVLRGEPLVKAWREYLGFTQAELAEKSGMKQSSLARIETGKINPRKTTLTRLAKAMAVDVEQLMDS